MPICETCGLPRTFYTGAAGACNCDIPQAGVPKPILTDDSESLGDPDTPGKGVGAVRSIDVDDGEKVDYSDGSNRRRLGKPRRR